MTPLTFYAVLAALAAFALHKKSYGALFFFCAGLLWLLMMQCIIAYTLHGGSN